MLLYIDGVATTQGITSNFADCLEYTGQLIFGQDGDFTEGNNLGMEQDTVAVYNRALNASEIISGRRFIDGNHSSMYALWTGSSGVDAMGNDNIAVISASSTSDGVIEILSLEEQDEQWESKASRAMREHSFWVLLAITITVLFHLLCLRIAPLCGYPRNQIQGGYQFPHIEIKVFLAMSLGMLDTSIGVLCARNAAMGWKVLAAFQILLVIIFISWLFKLSRGFVKKASWKPLANVTRRSRRPQDSILGEQTNSTMGGYLSPAEIMKFAHEMGMTKQEGRALFKELDTDGNGVLEYDEFSVLFSDVKAPLAMQRALNANGKMPREKVPWQRSTPLEGAAALVFAARCESGKWTPNVKGNDVNNAYGLLFSKFTPKHVSYYPASVVRFICIALIVNALAPLGFMQVIVLCILEVVTFISVILYAPYIFLAETRSECVSFLFRFLTQLIALLGSMGAFPEATTSVFMVNSQLFAIVQNALTQLLPIIILLTGIMSKLFCPSEEPNSNDKNGIFDPAAYMLPRSDVKLDNKPFAWGSASGAPLFRGTYLNSHKIVAKRFAVGHDSNLVGQPRSEVEAAAALEVARLADLAHPCLVKMFGTTPDTEKNGSSGRNKGGSSKSIKNSGDAERSAGDLESIEAGTGVDTSGAPGLFVVMGSYSGGNLAAYYPEEAFTKNEFVRIVAELLSALSFLHEYGVVHRDLRPEHVMLNDPKQKSVRLSGLLNHARLGNSSGNLSGLRNGSTAAQANKAIGNGDMSTVNNGSLSGNALIVGHPAYAAPELFAGDDELSKVNLMGADAYALGIMLWQLWFKRQPHENKAVHEIITFTTTRLRPAVVPGKGGIPVSHPAPPKPLAKLIKGCWAQEPLERPPMAEAAKMFEKEVGPAVLVSVGDITSGSALAARRAKMKAAAEKRPAGKQRQGGKGDGNDDSVAHLSPDEAAELRLQFQSAVAKTTGNNMVVGGGGGGGLGKKAFKELIREIMAVQLTNEKSSKFTTPIGISLDETITVSHDSAEVGTTGPTDADLNVAFLIADADSNGSVDENEFLALYALVKAGKVHGLSSSKGSSRFFGIPSWGKSKQGTGSQADAFRVALTAATASAGAHHGNDSSGDSQAATRRAAEREAVAWQDEVNALRSKFREACTLVSGQPLSRDHSGSGIILELGKADFKNLVKMVTVERKIQQPSDVDLEAAFELADADDSSSIDEEEFVKLFTLVANGEVHGLGGGRAGSSGSVGGILGGVIGSGAGSSKTDLNNTAQLARMQASVVGGLPVLTPEEVDTLKRAFQAACRQPAGGGGGGTSGIAALKKYAFMTLVKKLMQEDQPDVPLPPPKDLLAAFEVADADKSGSVDEEEFIKLYTLVKAG